MSFLLQPKKSIASLHVTFFIFTFVFSLFSLTSCARDPTIVTPIITGDDPSKVKLANAAAAISRSMNELARIQAASNLDWQKNKNLVDMNFNILGTASVDWAGPIEPLVRKLADALDYRVRILGLRPAVPVVVVIAAHNAPISSLLRDIDFQAGPKAKIVPNPYQKVIEIRYVHI